MTEVKVNLDWGVQVTIYPIDMKEGNLIKFRYNGDVFKKERPDCINLPGTSNVVVQQGRPKDRNTKLIRWIDSKGKQTWSVDDFFKDHPECNQNRKRVVKQITRFIELKRIIQIGKDKFRRNI